MSEEELEKLRIRVAELCGLPKTETRYKFGYKIRGDGTLHEWIGETMESALSVHRAIQDQGHCCFAIIEFQAPYETPDYCGNLDDIAEAVDTLEVFERIRYIDELSSIVPKGDCMGVLFPLVEAEAWQRALAFVRVKEAQQVDE